MAEKYCSMCETAKELTKENFYFRKSGVDCYCKECRKKISQEHRDLYPSISTYKPRNEFLNRERPLNFKRYMRENPFYFEDVFGAAATARNINRAAIAVLNEG
jgi:hypothetical protein